MKRLNQLYTFLFIALAALPGIVTAGDGNTYHDSRTIMVFWEWIQAWLSSSGIGG